MYRMFPAESAEAVIVVLPAAPTEAANSSLKRLVPAESLSDLDSTLKATVVLAEIVYPVIFLHVCAMSTTGPGIPPVPGLLTTHVYVCLEAALAAADTTETALLTTDKAWLIAEDLSDASFFTLVTAALTVTALALASFLTLVTAALTAEALLEAFASTLVTLPLTEVAAALAVLACVSAAAAAAETTEALSLKTPDKVTTAADTVLACPSAEVAAALAVAAWVSTEVTASDKVALAAEAVWLTADSSSDVTLPPPAAATSETADILFERAASAER